MNFLFLFIGLFLLAIVSIDFVWAILWVDHGSGLITNFVCNFSWTILKKLDKNNKLLALSGPIILILNLLLWVLFLWVSWTFIFLSFKNGLFNTVFEEAVGPVDYFYYTGYVLFTLGSGEMAPVFPIMKILSAFASGLGMVFLTLSLAYIINVIDGVIAKRRLGRKIFNLGRRPEEMALYLWDRDDFYNIESLFNDISSNLNDVSFRERAYPILQFYHGTDRANSVAYSIPVLYDLLLILQYGVSKDYKINGLAIKELKKSIEFYIETVEGYTKDLIGYSYILYEVNLEILENIGVKLEDVDGFYQILEGHRNIRTRLLDLRKENWEILKSDK